MSNLQPIDIEILPKLGKTGFLEAYNGITLCSVNGIIRITSLIEREIESLSVVFRGSYNQPKSTAALEKVNFILFFKCFFGFREGFHS